MMPKKIALILILLILVCNFSAFAQDNKVKLHINNKMVTNDLNYRLVEDNILIPLQLLTNNLPIKMKIYSAIDTLSLEYKEKKLKFRLGGNRLQVNNKLVNFPVAPYREEEKIMVPLQTLGEVLGLVIQSNPKQGTVNIHQNLVRITGMDNLEESSDGLKIKVSQQVDTKSMFLKNPARIVFDLEGTSLYRDFSDFKVESPLIEQMRIAQFNDNTVRIVLDLTTKAKHSIKSRAVDNGYEYRLQLTPLITDIEVNEDKIKLATTSSLTETSLDYLPDPHRVVVNIKGAVLNEQQHLQTDNPLFKKVRISQYKTEPNVVRLVIELNKKIQFKKEVREDGLIIQPIQTVLEKINYIGKDRLKISLNKKVEPRDVFLKSGSRLLIDFPVTRTKLKAKTFNYESELIDEVRVSQYDQTTTRVVVDLIAPLPHQLEWQGDQLIVSLFNKLTAVNLNKDKIGTEAKVELLAAGDAEVSRLINPRRVVIDIPNVVANKDEIQLPKPQGVIKDIRVSQYSTNPHQARVVLELKRSVSLVKNVLDNNLYFKLSNSNLAGKVIALDPGHGGKDPGALGYSKLREKEPVLEIALKLEKMLKEAGAKVIMTRRKDIFIPLEERVKIANRMNSDIFISIHLNGHRSANSFGTETFIAPDSKKDAKLLARFIQNSLINSLDTFDRGVKEEQLYVLEHTTMPSVLEEVVFISNQAEEDMVMKESFRRKSAEAIYKGITKYFELLGEEN